MKCKNKRKESNLRQFMVILLIVFIFGCQHKNPVDGTAQNGNTTKGYNLYIGNWAGDEVFVVDTDSNAVVDTIREFNINIWSFAVTKSGKKLYVTTREGHGNFPGKVFVVDLLSNHVKLIFNKVADVYTAPNGTIFIIAKEPFQLPRQFGTIDTLSDAITFFDTLDVRDVGFNNQSVVFDNNKPLLYAINNSKQLFAYDYEKKQVVRVYQTFFDPANMVISPDGRILYTSGGFVFDLEQDKVVARKGGPVASSLALSPDGEFLYVTDPGGYMIPEPIPSGKIFIFQTSTNRYIGEIDIRDAVPSGHNNITDHIVLMPDGQTAYVSGWFQVLYHIDLQAREVLKVFEIESFTFPMALGLKL